MPWAALLLEPLPGKCGGHCLENARAVASSPSLVGLLFILLSGEGKIFRASDYDFAMAERNSDLYHLIELHEGGNKPMNLCYLAASFLAGKVECFSYGIDLLWSNHL